MVRYRQVKSSQNIRGGATANTSEDAGQCPVTDQAFGVS